MRGILIVVVLLALALPVLAQTEFNPGETPAPAITAVPTPLVTTILQSAGTTSQTVQHRTRVRPLTAEEENAVSAYLCKHRQGFTGDNYAATDNALHFLLGINQSHLPLTRTPAQYMADYQTFTQLLGLTDWWVDIPTPQLVIPPLGLLPAVNPSQSVQLTPVHLNLANVNCTQPVCVALPVTVCPAGAVAFGQAGERRERVIGGVAGIQRHEQRPPEDETCGPGEPGPKPPPNNGEPGNPSGQVPCPPGSDPNRPPDQPTHGTGGQPWDPGPDHPHVADPVIPGQ